MRKVIVVHGTLCALLAIACAASGLWLSAISTTGTAVAMVVVYVTYRKKSSESVGS